MSDVRQHTLWGDLKEALRGTSQDFTEGPIGWAILLLAVPMVLKMVVESRKHSMGHPSGQEGRVVAMQPQQQVGHRP